MIRKGKSVFAGVPVIVKQAELQDVIDKRALRDGLRRDLEAADVEVARAEESVMAKLRQGAPLEVGHLTGRIAQALRVQPAWKRVCEEALGLPFIEKTIERTAPTVTPKLVVEAAPRT